MSRPSTPPDWATDVNYPAGSDPWSGLATKRVPSAGEIATGAIPKAPLPAQYLNYILGLHADWIGYLDASVGESLLGPGFDGAIAVDGTNTFAWATKAGADYTLTRDIYADAGGITFTNTGRIFTNGFRIYCRGTIDTTATTSPGGCIVAFGASGGAGGAQGLGSATGSIGGGGDGGVGATGTGANGVSVTYALGGAGGRGGTSLVSHSNGGTVTAPAASGAHPMLLAAPFFGYVLGLVAGAETLKALYGGGGGGGGTGNGFAPSGAGGGGGGGIACVAARELKLNSALDIQAGGGSGGTGTAAGKGGGGGGGALILVYGNKNGAVFSGAANCGGGSALAGDGAVAGGDGSVYEYSFADAASLSALSVERTGIAAFATGGSGAGYDYVDVTFADAMASTAYQVMLAVGLSSDSVGAPDAHYTLKTTAGFRIRPDAQFDGEVSWSAKP